MENKKEILITLDYEIINIRLYNFNLKKIIIRNIFLYNFKK